MVVAAVTGGCGLDLVVVVVGTAFVKTSEVILDFGFSLFGRDNIIDEFTLLGLGIGKECLVLRSVLLVLEIDGPLERLGDGDLGGVVFVTLETYEINTLDDARIAFKRIGCHGDVGLTVGKVGEFAQRITVVEILSLDTSGGEVLKGDAATNPCGGNGDEVEDHRLDIGESPEGAAIVEWATQVETSAVEGNATIYTCRNGEAVLGVGVTFLDGDVESEIIGARLQADAASVECRYAGSTIPWTWNKTFDFFAGVRILIDAHLCGDGVVGEVEDERLVEILDCVLRRGSEDEQ